MDGFLLLKSTDGRIIAVGDLINLAHGSIVHSRLIFHFHDGSVDDDVTVFRQGRTFQLLSDHHIQKGPSFSQPVDVFVDARTGTVVTRTTREGRQERKIEHLDLPPDLANGMLPAILENFPAAAGPVKVSYLATDPKPRIVGLSISPDGKDAFQVDGHSRDALRYRVHIDLGGLAGVVAPLIGKEPADTEVWVSAGEVHAFVKLVGPLYLRGPAWTMELTSPRWQDRH